MDPHAPVRMESRARGGGVRPAGRSSNHGREHQPHLWGQDQCLRFLLWKELFELSMAGRLGVQGMEGRGRGGTTTAAAASRPRRQALVTRRPYPLGSYQGWKVGMTA